VRIKKKYGKDRRGGGGKLLASIEAQAEPIKRRENRKGKRVRVAPRGNKLAEKNVENKFRRGRPKQQLRSAKGGQTHAGSLCGTGEPPMPWERGQVMECRTERGSLESP